jgi:hypothetical protein
MGGVAATSRVAAAMTRIVTTGDRRIRCTDFTSFSKLDFDSLEPRYRVVRLLNIKCRGVREIFQPLEKKIERILQSGGVRIA